MSSPSGSQMKWIGALVLAMAIATTARGQLYQPGDMNCDGVVNQSDIAPFLLAVNDPVGYAQQYPDCDIQNADINGDTMVNSLDVQPFFDLLGPRPVPVLPAVGLAGAIVLLLLVGLEGLKRRPQVVP